MGTDNYFNPPLSSLQPPAEFENEPKPLASVPLSKLFNPEAAYCPLCGELLPIDSKEKIVNSEPYLCCKVCKK